MTPIRQITTLILPFFTLLCAGTGGVAQQPAASALDGGNASPQISAQQYVEQLSHQDRDVRRRAAYLLGRIDAPAEVAVPALAKALSDRQMETRWYAIDALGHFGEAAAPAVGEIVKALESTLNDADVHRRGAVSLGRIGPAAKEAVPVLEAALKSDDALYQIAAAQALWRISQHEAAIGLLSQQAASRDGEIAFAAVVALGELGDADQQWTAPLLSALSHEDLDVRHAAAAALAAIGPPAIEPLSRLVASRDQQGRAEAARALGMITDEVRRDILYNNAASGREFAAAASPLVRTAFPALAGALGEEDPALRAAAQLALAKGGSAAVIQLLQTLGSEDRSQRTSAAEALIRAEAYLPKQRPLPENIDRVHARITETLVATMQGDDAITQMATVRLFAALEIGPAGEAALPYLQQALQTGDLATRRYADRAIDRLQTP